MSSRLSSPSPDRPFAPGDRVVLPDGQGGQVIAMGGTGAGGPQVWVLADDGSRSLVDEAHVKPSS